MKNYHKWEEPDQISKVLKSVGFSRQPWFTPWRLCTLFTYFYSIVLETQYDHESNIQFNLDFRLHTQYQTFIFSLLKHTISDNESFFTFTHLQIICIHCFHMSSQKARPVQQTNDDSIISKRMITSFSLSLSLIFTVYWRFGESIRIYWWWLLKAFCKQAS